MTVKKSEASIIVNTVAASLGIISVGILGWIGAGQMQLRQDVSSIKNTRFTALDHEKAMNDTEDEIQRNRHDIDWLIKLQFGPIPDEP